MRNGMIWVWRGTSTALAALALGGCVDEKIVYRDRPAFVTPPAAAANFLGYSDSATSKTVCGNCHVTQQAKWEQTAHSDAWATLQASGRSQAACEGCHSVGNKGNVVTDPAVGYASTRDTRYLDVQCESCHGPGLNHVTSPSRGQMLASVHVDTGVAVTNGCAECHSGTHNPFAEEWRESRHATSYTRSYNGATATAPDVPFGPRAACQSCHIGQAVLANWGVNTNYTEKSAGQTIATAERAGLSRPARVAQFGATALRSRDRASAPSATAFDAGLGRLRDSPHAPQGRWSSAPPAVTAGCRSSVAVHAQLRPIKLCATCHVQKYNVNDAHGRLPGNGGRTSLAADRAWMPAASEPTHRPAP